MSDSQLPEDSAGWPSDPYELLGVTYHDDAKTVRRAYLRLARRFKPEHHPTQFQRVREAYDAIHGQLEWQKQYADYEYQSDSPTFDLPKLVETGNSRPLYADAVESQGDEYWQLAIDGDDESAYLKLVSQFNQHSGHSDVHARLYWLLKLNPQLDNSRSPCDWLVAGLRESQLVGPLRELYRRELEGSQAEAASARCTSLMESDSPPGPLADLAQWRWLASPSGTLISHDLMHLRERFLPDDESTWFRLLLAAVDHLAWSGDSRDLLRRCVDEIQHMEHLHQDTEHELDRMELLLEISNQWRQVERHAGIPDQWKRLIPVSWTHPSDRIRPQLLNLARAIAENPLTGLAHFDRLANCSTGAAAQLGDCIELLYRYEARYDDGGLEEASIWRLVERFIATHGLDYNGVRQALLNFCLDHAVDPDRVAHIADDHQWHVWSDSINNDGPLRYVYAAYRCICG